MREVIPEIASAKLASLEIIAGAKSGSASESVSIPMACNLTSALSAELSKAAPLQASAASESRAISLLSNSPN